MSPTLNEKEILILNHISKNSSVSQRDLAKTVGLSLGLINVILKRFIKTGYIKAIHLNKRKMQYLLTPQGFLETIKRTYQHTTNTIRHFKKIRTELVNIISSLHASGYDYFSIHGDGDLKDLVESTLQECLEEKPVTLGKVHSIGPRSVVLNLTTDPIAPEFKGDVVNIVEKIGASGFSLQS